MFSLQNKTAVITGGGSGIGKAVAILFARQQAHVHVLDLNQDALDGTAQEITGSGGAVTTHAVDVSRQDAVKDIFQRIGSLDILVNSAGISHIGKAETTSEEDFDRVYQVNIKGVYNCLHEAIPLMKGKGGV